MLIIKCSPLLDDICYSNFFSEKNIVIKITENNCSKALYPTAYTNTKPSFTVSTGSVTHIPRGPGRLKGNSIWTQNSFAPGYKVWGGFVAFVLKTGCDLSARG